MPSARYATRPLLRRSDVITAAATGVLTLIDPARVPPRLKPAYRLAVAGVSAAGIYAALDKDPDLGKQPVPRTALAVGVGGTLYATMGLWERVDAVVHGVLRRRGVRYPRLKLAASSVAVSLAIDAFDSVQSRFLPDDETVRADLSPELLAIATAILAETDDHSAPLLRAQLHQARAVGWGEVDELCGQLDLEVGPVTHWVVPHDFTFPVRAEFDHAGETYAVRLRVDGGRLSVVMLDQVDFMDTDPVDDWPSAWPPMTEVRLRHDPVTPQGADGGAV